MKIKNKCEEILQAVVKDTLRFPIRPYDTRFFYKKVVYKKVVLDWPKPAPAAKFWDTNETRALCYHECNVPSATCNVQRAMCEMCNMQNISIVVFVFVFVLFFKGQKKAINNYLLTGRKVTLYTPRRLEIFYFARERSDRAK